MRVGGVCLVQYEHIIPIPELPGFYFLKVYPDSAEEFYYVILTPEFKHDLDELTEYRKRWGDKITPETYIICPKRHSERKKNLVMDEDSIRSRMKALARKAGIDLTNIQPNHGMRKAGNTAMKNAHMDKDFKEMLMGHSTGLDDTYYDVENPESRKEIIVEYMKAIDSLTLSDEAKKELEIQALKKEKTEMDDIRRDMNRLQETVQALMNRSVAK
jgi:hypothetical protein